MNATHIVKASEIERAWYLFDAEGLTLGRVASEVAKILKGKNKPTYSTNMDCGDYVIVINASKVSLSGNNKLKQKFYYNVSGYAGGLRKRSAAVMLKDYPEEMLERSIRGMLPKGRLGRQIGKKLFVYAGAEHKHEAQQPVVKELKF